MKLIGMLDSPYVRRVAICLKLLKLDFEHQSISVFSTYEAFAKINPVVKAPTLILDNGQRVMDSTVILQYVATLAAPDQRIFPASRWPLVKRACRSSTNAICVRRTNSMSRGSIA